MKCKEGAPFTQQPSYLPFQTATSRKTVIVRRTKYRDYRAEFGAVNAVHAIPNALLIIARLLALLPLLCGFASLRGGVVVICSRPIPMALPPSKA